MASKLTNGLILKNASRCLASQAAAAQKAAPALQIDKAPSGATVVSFDRNDPVARVGVFVKAGSRYASVPGLSHALQLCGAGGLSSNQRTGFNMVRTAEQLGATKNVVVGREVATYAMSSFRDCLDEILSILSTITSNTEYFIHEFPNESEVERMKASLKISNLDRIKDLIVKAAFRSQSLGNSIYTPDFNVGNIDVHQVNDFVRNTHGSQGLVIVGSGMDADVLYAGAASMGVQEGGVASAGAATKYLSGDLRVETGGSSATVAVAAGGAKFASTDSLALLVGCELLGSSSPSVSYGEHVGSVLARAMKGAPGSVTSFTESWSDAGLVGFTLETSGSDAPKAVQSLVSAVKNLNAGDKDVAAAKASVITKMVQNSYGCDEIQNIGTQLALTGNYYDVEQSIKAVEGLSAAVVNKAMSKAFSGKLSLAAIGNVNNVPYADTL